jgi:hypothetical protein
MHRLAFVLVVCGLVGCSNRGDTANPGEAAGRDTPGSAGDDATAGTPFRYTTEPTTLVETTSFSMSNTGGGQFFELTLGLTATLQVQPAGDDLRVAWTVDAVDELQLAGAFEPGDGKDPKAYLLQHGRGAYLMDRRGDVDEAKSSLLPQNEARNQEIARLQKAAAGGAAPGAGPQILVFMPLVLGLPYLPTEGLTEGKVLTIEDTEDVELQGTGIVLPTETKRTYAYVKTDASGGTRIAELQHTVQASGETQAGDGVIVIETKEEGTLLFDLDRGVPLSYDVTRSETHQMGDTAGESTTVVHATWESAGPKTP